MKDEGFLSPAGKRFVIIAAIVILGGLLAYYVVAEDVSIDLDELTRTSTTSTTTDLDIDVPEVTVPGVAEDPYLRCVDDAVTAQDVIDCSNR